MKDEQPKSWWQTIPGCLTGLAGIITATAGLVVALQQAGILKGSDQFNPTTLPTPNVTSTTNEVKVVINDPDGYTNVRSGQGASYGIIERINESEVFYAIPQKNSDWWPIRTADGKYGYIHRSRIKIQDAN